MRSQPTGQVEPPVMLTAEQAAERLGTTAEHVLRLVRIGELPHRRIGRFIRFTDGDLVEYLQAVRVDREVER